MKLVFAISAAIVSNVTACTEVQSTFRCGPAAYTDGPVLQHQPKVANSCPSPSIAAWAEPRQFGTRQYTLASVRSLLAADR
jgi:hypothetical protein